MASSGDRDKANKKMRKYKDLCNKFDVVMIQETHGCSEDEETLVREVSSHKHYLSCFQTRLAGGLLISVRRRFITKYVKNIIYEAEEVARMQHLILVMNFGELHFVNLHLNPEYTKNEANNFFVRARGLLDLTSSNWGFIAGDFNAPPTGEPRVCVEDNSIMETYSHCTDVADEVFQNMTEIGGNYFTHRSSSILGRTTWRG